MSPKSPLVETTIQFMQDKLNVNEAVFFEIIAGEFGKIRHPYSLVMPDYELASGDQTAKVFVSSLKYEINKPEYESLYELVLTACKNYYDASFGESHNKIIAIQALATKFEPFVKKLP